MKSSFEIFFSDEFYIFLRGDGDVTNLSHFKAFFNFDDFDSLRYNF